MSGVYYYTHILTCTVHTSYSSRLLLFKCFSRNQWLGWISHHVTEDCLHTEDMVSKQLKNTDSQWQRRMLQSMFTGTCVKLIVPPLTCNCPYSHVYDERLACIKSSLSTRTLQEPDQTRTMQEPDLHCRHVLCRSLSVADWRAFLEKTCLPFKWIFMPFVRPDLHNILYNLTISLLVN